MGSQHPSWIVLPVAAAPLQVPLVVLPLQLALERLPLLWPPDPLVAVSPIPASRQHLPQGQVSRDANQADLASHESNAVYIYSSPVIFDVSSFIHPQRLSQLNDSRLHSATIVKLLFCYI